MLSSECARPEFLAAMASLPWAVPTRQLATCDCRAGIPSVRHARRRGFARAAASKHYLRIRLMAWRGVVVFCSAHLASYVVVVVGGGTAVRPPPAGATGNSGIVALILGVLPGLLGEAVRPHTRTHTRALAFRRTDGGTNSALPTYRCHSAAAQSLDTTAGDVSFFAHVDAALATTRRRAVDVTSAWASERLL